MQWVNIDKRVRIKDTKTLKLRKNKETQRNNAQEDEKKRKWSSFYGRHQISVNYLCLWGSRILPGDTWAPAPGMRSRTNLLPTPTFAPADIFFSFSEKRKFLSPNSEEDANSMNMNEPPLASERSHASAPLRHGNH